MIQEINLILQMVVSLLLIYYVFINIKLDKLVKSQKDLINLLKKRFYHAIYGVSDVDPENLDFNMAIRDVIKYKSDSIELKSIKPEYNKLLIECPKLEKELQIQKKLREMTDYDIQKVCTKAGIEGTFLKEYWLAVFVSTIIQNLEELQALKKIKKGTSIEIEELNKIIQNLQANNKEDIESFNKKLHVKNQTIYRLRRKLGIKTNRKTGQNKNNK